MTNPTGKAIVLDPCPAFTQILEPNFRAPHDIETLSTRLNCRAAPSAVLSRRSVRFAMEYVIRPDVPTGYARLTWVFGLETRDGAYASVLVRE